MSVFEWVALALVVVVGSARVTRLLTYDKFPPIRWARDKFIDWADARDSTRAWALVAYCPYCMSFWVTVAVLLTAWWAGVITPLDPLPWYVQLWWLLMSAFAGSYLAAIVMVHDGDDSEDDEGDQ